MCRDALRVRRPLPALRPDTANGRAEPAAKRQKCPMPEQMSPAQVDTKLGKGASAAGWTGKLYGVQRAPNYFHKIAGKQNSARDAKAARLRLLETGS